MQDEYSQVPKEEKEQGTEVPVDLLDEQTLGALIEAFVLREGTDYGEVEISLKTKVAQILNQLKHGDLKIVFDQTSETTSIVPGDRHATSRPRPGTPVQ